MPLPPSLPLTASGITYINLLGASVAMSGSYVVTGAPDTQVGGNAKQGAVYVFKQVIIKTFLPYLRR